MEIIDHGFWKTSSRPNSPIGARAPESAIFCARESDGVDWYELAFGESLNNKILATALPNADATAFMVQAVATNPQRVFPQNSRLLEFKDYTGTDPVAELSGRIYTPGSNDLAVAPIVVAPVITLKADIWRRVTDSEAETIIRVLGQQSPRKQRLFADAQNLDHADENFAELYAGFVAAFGKERADVILAPSSAN
jgi:hypothetical protein